MLDEGATQALADLGYSADDTIAAEVPEEVAT